MRSFTVFTGRVKVWITIISDAIEIKYKDQFGFGIRETTATNLKQYMYRPKDSSSLAVTRILFGMAMLFDIPDERGGASMEKRWGNPETCHFPLISFVKPLPMPHMALVYGVLWLGALGITLGYKYRLSSITFTVLYWYLFMIEKSFWNNHSYLFGLFSLLLAVTEAHSYWSIDACRDSLLRKQTVPYWNYFIIKYQFFIVYFMAGLKKGTAEWLTGYSVQNLSEHWVFSPFRLFLSVSQIDYLIVHLFVFVFDLTIAIWMMWSRTRHTAMAFCALFNLMNSRLFRIGMFPWVCLATMPLFYSFDWPKIAHKYINIKLVQIQKYLKHYENIKEENKCKVTEKKPDKEKIYINGKVKENFRNIQKENDENVDQSKDSNEFNEILDCEKDNGNDEVYRYQEKRNVTCFFILFYIFSQAFLPYSHFLTQGYNNWTNGLYGYSWDMMVHTWDIHSVVVKVVDNNGEEFYIDPYHYTPNDRWTRHGDMIYQYAQCLKKKVFEKNQLQYSKTISDDISIYIDVWCSMNGRFTQRMFDPYVDLVNVSWSPFQPVSFLMPLLDEALHWRSRLKEISDEINKRTNYKSDIVFFADFPGYEQEKYIPQEYVNVTLNVLEGSVAYIPEITKSLNDHSYLLGQEDQKKIVPGTFHKILNIGTQPAFYMYMFINSSEIASPEVSEAKPKLPILWELQRRFINMFIFGNTVVSNVFQLFFEDSCEK